MGYYDKDTIDILVKGSTETDFTSVTYRATVVTRAKSGPAAKALAEPVIENVKLAIRHHAETAGIDTTRLKTTLATESERNRSTDEFVGYKTTWSITFTGKNVAASLAVHDSLTSLENVEAGTPVYNVNDDAGVHARAFADAVKKARDKFNNHCQALGVSSDLYEVKSWSIQEEHPGGKTLSFKDGLTVKPTGFEPGKGSLDMRVTFTYGVRKS